MQNIAQNQSKAQSFLIKLPFNSQILGYFFIAKNILKGVSFMKCEGNFIYKGIEKRQGGEFTNERGQVIKYDDAFKITLDEVNEGKVITRTFTFSKNNTELENKFKSLKLYDNIVVAFDVVISRNNVKLVPFDMICEKED